MLTSHRLLAVQHFAAEVQAAADRARTLALVSLTAGRAPAALTGSVQCCDVCHFDNPLLMQIEGERLAICFSHLWP
jgi:hypothetical protein